MDQNTLKQLAAEAAMAYIKPELDNKSIVGVGTGSTTNLFIDELAKAKMGCQTSDAKPEH